MSQNNVFPTRSRIIILILTVALIATVLALLCIGRYSISVVETVSVLWNAVFGDTAALDPYQVSVILNVRLPRILMGLIVGAGLSIAGTSYQAIFGNPLVSPDILGVSSGAGFGASLAILLSFGAVLTQTVALSFGLLAVVLVLFVSRVRRSTELFMLVLSGVVIQALFDALISLIKYVADPQDKLPAITVWLMGSLASSTYKDVMISWITIAPCLIIMLGLRWKLNLLSLDEEEARSLGINVVTIRRIIIVVSTIITAVTVSLCGVIGWIGLIIPHIGRMLVGTDHRALLPVSMLLGAIYLLLIDTVARTLTAAEIPLSILTAIIGAPFFVWMLRKSSGGKG